MDKTCIEEKKLPKAGRDNKGRFMPGVSGNPKGCNREFIKELCAALEKTSKREGFTNFASLVADRATRYESVLIAVLKKICPDQLQHSGEVTHNVFFENLVTKAMPSRLEQYASQN